MKVGYSVKKKLKSDWKKFYFSEKLRKVYGELPFWTRVRFVLTGKIIKDLS